MPSLVQQQEFVVPHGDPVDSYEAPLEAQLPPTEQYPYPKCGQHFSQKPSLEAHQRESLHASCYNCDLVFSTRELQALHMQSHAPTSARTPLAATQFRCCDCERDFKSEESLTYHLRYSKRHGPGKGDKNKKKKKKKKKQNQQEEDNQPTRCKKCNKTFKNEGALAQHLTSMRHHPLSDIKCLAHVQCKKHFNCPSGLLQHLESGKCVSGMAKTKLNAAIAANDTEGTITSRGVTAQWRLEDSSPASATSRSQIGSPMLTPTSTEFFDSYPSSPIITPTSSLSTSTNFHSMLTLRPRTQSGLQTCPLCPPSRTRKFKDSALRQHLSSSVHAPVSMSLPLLIPDEISFHCPRALMSEGAKNKPLKQFSTVSGLAQHLESGACGGGRATFRRVVEYVQEELKGLGFGKVKLLR